MPNSSENLLRRITSYLLLNYFYLPSNDLMTGRMGGVLYFKHYARYSSERFYDDFADSILESLFGNLKDDMPVGFHKGYCGTGWAVEYLIKNGMAEGNTDEILGNIDKKIMERDPKYISDMSFETGLSGIVYYIVCRMKSFDRKGDPMPFDRLYLDDISGIVNSPEFANYGDFCAGLTEEFNACVRGEADYTSKLTIPPFLLDDLPANFESFGNIPIGIYKGLTGVALKMIGV